MQYLDGDQRARIEQLAKDRGMACQRCGSPDLDSNDVAQTYIGGNFGVEMWCSNRDDQDAHPGGVMIRQPLKLNPDDARRVGLA